MKNYVLIQSTSRRESSSAVDCQRLAADLAASGNTVTLYLVQNGVLGAHGNTRALDTVFGAGVRIMADDFSLRERGISNASVHDEVEITPLDFVVDRLVAGDTVIWH